MILRIIIPCFLFLNFCQSQESIQIKQKFNPEKKYNYEIIRGQVDSKKPDFQNLKSVTDVFVLTKKEEENIFHFSWSYGDSKTEGIDFNLLDEKSKKQINIYKGLTIEIRINELGQILEFLNFDNLKSTLKEVMKNQYIMMNSDNEVSEIEISNYLNFFEDSISSPEILIPTYFPELNLFFSMNGEYVNTKKSSIENAEMSNPFGGPSFNSLIETKTENFKDYNYSIVSQQTIEKDELNSKLEETFKVISKKAGKEYNNNDIPNFNTDSSTKYIFNSKDQIISKIEYRKRISSQDTERIQLLEIKLK